MIKQIFREIAIWILSLVIAWVIWYPVYSIISYKFIALGLTSFVLLIQLARWFIFYDKVQLFQNTYIKVIVICSLSFISFVIWSEGQKIVALVEEMDIKHIVSENTTPVFLTFEQTYNLFIYLRNLLVVSNFGTPCIAILLILKIVYKTLGMDKKRRH